MKKFTITFCILICLTGVGCTRPSGRSDTGEMLAILLVIAIIGLFILLGKYSRLLREDTLGIKKITYQDDQHSTGRAFREQPFSLTKVQLGVWTVVICSSYLYLTLFKDNCTEIAMNKTAAILMGIFAGSAISSKIIDNNMAADPSTDVLNRSSQGFFIDILSDQWGVSIHRFQHLLWTLIAVIIYLYRLSEVTTGCALPELGDTLLALTGISSATYVAMRSGEYTRSVTPPENGFSLKETYAPPVVDSNNSGSISVSGYSTKFYR